jgi:mRNA interferase HigB
MQVVSKRTLWLFWEKHPQAETPLRTWHAVVEKAMWAGPQDVREQFGSVDFVSDNRAIFNIGGNRFRLVAHVSYEFKAVLVKFVGTHAEYDEIDAATVGGR